MIHREITGVYLLALAVHHDGALATFEKALRIAAAPGAEAWQLKVLTPGG